jgi:hypothetical protein
MKTTVRRIRAAGSRRRHPQEFDLRHLGPGYRTMQFTLAEARLIEKAAAVSGYPGDGAAFGRDTVLHVAAEIVSGAKAPAETKL